MARPRVRRLGPAAAPPPGRRARAGAHPTPRRGTPFLAWYGPLGVAAAYHALFAERSGPPEAERIVAVCTLANAASVLVHSVSATPGVRRYAGRRATTTLRHPLTPGIDRAP